MSACEVNPALGNPREICPPRQHNVVWARLKSSRRLACDAVWETRNGEQEVRETDDMLVSGLNMAAGYESTHVPVTSDAVAAQIKAVNSQFPKEKLSGYPSDFANAASVGG